MTNGTPAKYQHVSTVTTSMLLLFTTVLKSSVTELRARLKTPVWLALSALIGWLRIQTENRDVEGCN